MPVLGLKLAVTPILIAVASLIGRRWGPSVGGWIVALPFTSGPILLFLAIDHGPAFAATAAVGALAGLAAIAAFTVAYAFAGRARGPTAAFAAAALAFVLAGLALQPLLDDATWVVLGVVIAAIALALRLVPSGGGEHGSAVAPRWDLPGRMLAATLLVVGLTAIAPILGPHASGLLATFPVYLSVMAVFAQRAAGLGAALDVMRGLLVGLFGTAFFFVIVNVGLEPLGVGPTFALAIAVALGSEAIALGVLRSAGLVVEPVAEA